MPDQFHAFTPRARRVLALSEAEAQRFNHNYIGTEHILLGLVREEEGVAARALANLGVQLATVRSAVEFIIGRGDRSVLGEIGLTPRSRTVIGLAIDEARQLGHDHIGTEHLLLGLLAEGEGIGHGVLESFGVSLDRARAEVLRIVGSGSPAAGVTGMGGAALGREPAAEEGRDDDAESPVEAEPADALRVTYEVGRPVSSDLLRLLDLAADEATRLDHGHVRPAHLLLALLEQSGPVRRAVREGGGDVDLLRGEVERYATEQDRLLRDLATARRAKDAAAADDAERAEAARRRELDLLERLRRLEQG